MLHMQIENHIIPIGTMTEPCASTTEQLENHIIPIETMTEPCASTTEQLENHNIVLTCLRYVHTYD